MTRYFLYGTLRHPELFERVAGTPATAERASLAGHAVHWVAGEAYPVLIAKDGSEADGVLVDVSAEAAARLDFFEEGFGYRPETVTVETETGPREARVYLSDTRPELGALFDIEDWASRWATVMVSAAEEVMARYGKTDSDAAHALWSVFCARGWARAMAAEGAPHALRTDMGRGDLPRLEIAEGGHNGFFRLRRFTVSYPQYRGGYSEAVTREAFCAFDAALVLPYDPVTDQVLLIEQFRYGPLLRGDPGPWVLEPIAGLVDAGEDPMETARREAVEEARLELSELRPMLKVYASPGYSTEYFHCFLGLADLAGRGTVHAGLDEENEDIRSHVISFDAAMGLVETGEVNAGPLAMMLLWLARERPALRTGA